MAWLRSGRTTQRMRSSRAEPSASGSTTSAAVTRESSVRMVRGESPSPACDCHLLQQLPEGIAEEADQDVRLDAFGLLVPHRYMHSHSHDHARRSQQQGRHYIGFCASTSANFTAAKVRRAPASL